MLLQDANYASPSPNPMKKKGLGIAGIIPLHMISAVQGPFQLSASMQFIQRTLVVVGNTLALVGCLALALGAIGIFDPETFAIGISSGIRVIGTVAIAGSLMSAIGYGIDELQDN